VNSYQKKQEVQAKWVDKRRRIHQYRGLRWMRYRLSTLSSDYCLLTTWVAGVNPRWNNIDHVMLNTNRFRVNIVYTFSGICAQKKVG
jgi:hypothetical protein